MPHQWILTAREAHSAATPQQYADQQRAFLARRREHGHRVAEHADPGTVVARVNAGRWIADCPCGNGIGIDPAWPEARCFGCGAVFARILWPDDPAAIEAVLTLRPAQATRNWEPGETPDRLRAENLAHGVPARRDA